MQLRQVQIIQKFLKFLCLMLSTALAAVVISNNIQVTNATTPSELNTSVELATAPNQSNEDQNEIRKVVVKELSSVAGRETTPEVGSTFIAGNYAVANWLLGDGGGQAVLVKKQNKWEMIAKGGGAVNASYLHHLGVPEEQTQKLLSLMHRANG